MSVIAGIALFLAMIGAGIGMLMLLCYLVDCDTDGE